MKPKVYLCGPMSGMNFEDAVGWRRYFNNAAGEHFEFLSPMRDKSAVADDTYYTKWTEDYQPLEGIIVNRRRDKLDVRRCDAVVVNFLNDTGTKSTGSTVEVGWADAWSKPIILVMRPGSIHDHEFIREAATITVPDYTQAIQSLMSLFNLKY
jgi:nucleoside 2-deoxyribosyltransferase